MDSVAINKLKWRDPTNGQERISITKLLVKNNIKLCSEFQVKKLKEEVYVVACNHDGYNWQFYSLDLIEMSLKEIDDKEELDLPR